MLIDSIDCTLELYIFQENVHSTCSSFGCVICSWSEKLKTKQCRFWAKNDHLEKELYLKDGDELYTHNPTTEPNEAKKIEVGDQDPMVLEEIDALYVMRKH
ncbi:hypothetical protein DdX_19016 [Ditylenchus destructor]|uniref:Uncharacterized protein n=1 Tax=Ditylenchus destructor TaxID=166010 RepID=A0AAD4MKG8_9BILA|nr:hypothetical protein DdX_19016 [Ditylenchus destructor]